MCQDSHECESVLPGRESRLRWPLTTYNLLCLDEEEELSAPVITYVRTDFRDDDLMRGCGRIRKLNNSLEYPVFSATFANHEVIFMGTGSGSSNILTALYEGLSRGLHTIVRVGACGALGGLNTDEVIVAESALCLDRVSRTLLHRTRVAAHQGLTERVVYSLEHGGVRFTRGMVASADAMYLFENEIERAKRAGACAWDLETAAILAVGRRFGVQSASILLTVSDENGRSIASYPPIRRQDYVRCVLEALSAGSPVLT